MHSRELGGMFAHAIRIRRGSVGYQPLFHSTLLLHCLSNEQRGWYPEHDITLHIQFYPKRQNPKVFQNKSRIPRELDIPLTLTNHNSSPYHITLLEYNSRPYRAILLSSHFLQVRVNNNFRNMPYSLRRRNLQSATPLANIPNPP
jgi:hypothetical protein